MYSYDRQTVRDTIPTNHSQYSNTLTNSKLRVCVNYLTSQQKNLNEQLQVMDKRLKCHGTNANLTEKTEKKRETEFNH